MTEPVAYLNKYLDKSTNITRYKPENQRLLSSDPLYTAEKLHPRVKMTQAEFDEFNSIPESSSVYGAMVALYSSNIIKHVKLINRFSGNGGQIEFANLWFDFRIKHKLREETIEIAPDMKWFVRSKEPEGEDEDEYYLFLSGYNLYDLEYFPFNVNAKQFDTKEDAEKWTNPLTEAVQLPVEGE